MALDNILAFAHQLLASHIHRGDTVVDATAGNGHDSLCLAQCVGDKGRVYAFDIAKAALVSTQARLNAAGVGHCLHPIHAGHESMAQYISTTVSAVVFNCGWRPGGDKAHTTQARTTIMAMQQALDLLAVGGLLVAVLYPGHQAGAQEAQSVCAWASHLPQQQFNVLQYQFINRVNCPPYLIAIEKLPVNNALP